MQIGLPEVTPLSNFMHTTRISSAALQMQLELSKKSLREIRQSSILSDSLDISEKCLRQNFTKLPQFGAQYHNKNF